MSRQQGADVFGENSQKGKKSVVFLRRHCCKYRYLLSTVDGPAAPVSSVAQIPHDNKYKEKWSLALSCSSTGCSFHTPATPHFRSELPSNSNRCTRTTQLDGVALYYIRLQSAFGFPAHR